GRDRRGPERAPAAARCGPLRRADADAHTAWLDGRLLPDLRDRPAHVRRELAADRLDPSAGVGVLDGAGHVHGPELRRLLRRPDADERDQPAGPDLAARERVVPLRPPPVALRPSHGAAPLD